MMQLIKKTTLLLVVLAYLFLDSFSQDHIILLSGKEIQGKVLEINQNDIKYLKQKKKKTKELYIDKNDVFAIQYEDRLTKILYHPDSSDLYDFSISEMSMYINGEQDALKNYKSPVATINGFVVGATAGVFVPTFYALLFPASYVMIEGLIYPKLRKESVSNPNYLQEEIYIRGFKASAKNIKIQNVIKGSVIGLVSGIIIRAIIIKNN
ncbi:MAG: hypothetical protein ABII90_13855 [Bacteroidota bacterium]